MWKAYKEFWFLHTVAIICLVIGVGLGVAGCPRKAEDKDDAGNHGSVFGGSDGVLRYKDF